MALNSLSRIGAPCDPASASGLKDHGTAATRNRDPLLHPRPGWTPHRGRSDHRNPPRSAAGLREHVIVPSARYATSASVSCGLTAVDVQDFAGDERGLFEIEDPVDDV